MKKLIILYALALGACASQQNAAYTAKREHLEAQTRADNIAIKAGTMKRSEFFQREYDALAAPPVLPMDREGMKASSDMIDVAKKYEAGQITKDDYDAAARHVMIAYQGAVQQIQAEANERDAANRRAALGAYLMTRPATATCTRYGNTASCTAY